MPRQHTVDPSAVTTIYFEQRRRSRLRALRRAARLVTVAAVLSYTTYRLGAAGQAGQPGPLVAILTVLGIIAWVRAIVCDFRVHDDQMRSRVLLARIDSLHRRLNAVAPAVARERDKWAS
ncbi:MAG: hypothetical protein L0H79_13585 [Intrasporangium sp.]|uniref:hypothetical protein n=1 Tax=Intrasporangium sp. TaxID=1925024 RepID=UPI00264934E6|nr:hypothetical protein [Intrasporangium sp.]MDN5796771.1 hypothetical protein [Intrasporangium sp.]